MQAVDVHLSETNLKKFRKHEPTLIAAEQLGKGPHKIYLKNRKFKRVQTAIRKNKGIHLVLDVQELAALESGGSLKSFFRGVGRALKQVHREIKPALRKGLQTVVKQGLKTAIPVAAAFTGMPQSAVIMNAAVDRYSDKAVGKLGDVTGAWGLQPKGLPQSSHGKGFKPAGY